MEKNESLPNHIRGVKFFFAFIIFFLILPSSYSQDEIISHPSANNDFSANEDLVSALEAAIGELEEKTTEKQDVNEQLSRLATLEEQVAEYERKINQKELIPKQKVAELLESVSRKVQLLKKRQNDLLRQIQEKSEQVKSLQERAVKTEAQFKQQVRALQDKVDILQKELILVRQGSSSVLEDSKLAELQDRLAEVSREKEKLARQVTQANAQLQQLRTALDSQLTAKVKESGFEDGQEVLAAIKGQLEQRNQEIVRLQRRITDLEQSASGKVARDAFEEKVRLLTHAEEVITYLRAQLTSVTNEKDNLFQQVTKYKEQLALLQDQADIASSVIQDTAADTKQPAQLAALPLDRMQRVQKLLAHIEKKNEEMNSIRTHIKEILDKLQDLSHQPIL